MTTQDLGRVDGSLGDLFDRSPAVTARTAPAAEISFLLGTVGFLTAPFSLTFGLCVILAGMCVVTSIVGLAQASRNGVAGGALAGAALVLSLLTLALVGLRYLGLDTTFGDAMLPAIGDALRSLSALIPSP
jgi:hypothetical protein